MIPPIVVGYSPRTADRAPARFAAAVASRTGAPVVLATVLADATPRTGFDALADELRGTGVEVRSAAIRRGTPAEALAAVVTDQHPALVVVGSTTRGRFGRVRPGGTAKHLLRESPCAIAVVPRGHDPGDARVRVIGAGFTPTPEGRSALRVAAAFARATGGALRAVMVLDPRHAEQHASSLLARTHLDQDPREDADAAERLQEEDELSAAIADLAPDLDAESDVLFQGTADGLVAASHTLDLLVLGGPSRRVMEHAACPVLVLPRGAPAAVDLLAGAVDAPAARRDSRSRVGRSPSDPIRRERR